MSVIGPQIHNCIPVIRDCISQGQVVGSGDPKDAELFLSTCFTISAVAEICKNMVDNDNGEGMEEMIALDPMERETPGYMFRLLPKGTTALLFIAEM